MKKVCEYEGCQKIPLKFGECCYKHSPKCEYPKCKKVVRQDGFCCKEHKKICQFKGCKRIISFELSVCRKHQKTCQVCKRRYRGEKCDSYECKICKTEGCNNKPCAWTYCQVCRCEGGINSNCQRKKDENRKTCKKCHDTMYITWVLGQLFSDTHSQRDILQFKYPIKKIMKKVELPYFNLRRSTCKVNRCHVQLPIKMYFYDYIPTCERHRNINFCLQSNCLNKVDQFSEFYPYCREICEPSCRVSQCKYYNSAYSIILCRHCVCRSKRCSQLSLGNSSYCLNCHQSHVLYFMFCKKLGFPRDIYKKILKMGDFKRFANRKLN
jgi:hypothetical protein